MSSRSLSFLLPVCAGLMVGATGIWLVRPARPAPLPPRQTPGAPAAHATTAPTLLLPPKLASAEAEAALAAWLALGAPTDGSAPASLSVQENTLRALLTVFSDAQFPPLLETLFARSDPASASLRQTAIGIWLHRHPAAVAAWVLTAELPAEGDTRLHLARQVGMFWADEEPLAAIAWTESIPDPTLRSGVLAVVLPHLMATDPARALALAHAQGNEFLDQVRESLFGEWSKNDPATAFQTLGAHLLAENRDSWPLRQGLVQWLKTDLSAAVAWLQKHDERHNEDHNSTLANTLMQGYLFQGAQATVLDILLRHPEIPQHSQRVSDFLSQWHRNDPAAAAAWLDRLPDAAARADLIERLVPTAGSDATQAQSYLDLAVHLPPGPARDDRIATWVAAWAQTDPAAASAWLETREKTDPTLAVAADRVEGRLVAALAATDPAAALARFQDLPTAARNAAAPDIARAWAKTDPAAATRWLAEQLPQLASYPQRPSEVSWAVMQGEVSGNPYTNSPDATAQLSAFSHSVFQWSRREPLAALRWAEALTDPLQKRTALGAVTERYGQQGYGLDVPRIDPQAQAELITQIQDPALRINYLSSHLRKWLRADEKQALTWLDTHDTLTPEQAAQLIEQANSSTP